MPNPQSTFASTLAELSDTLLALNPPINPRLRPPATEKDIRNAEEALGIQFPDELSHMLACHDGQQFHSSDSGYGDPLVPMMRLLPNRGTCSHYWMAGTQQIVEYTQSYRDDYAEYFHDEQFETFGPACHHDKFVVFTATENADCLVLDLAPKSGGKMGQVLMYCTQPFEIAVIAERLSSFIKTLLYGYRTGRFEFDSNEFFTSYCES